MAQSLTQTVYRDNWVRPETAIFDADIEALVPDDGIKLKNPLGERFWVKFILKTTHGELIGQINNHLILPSEYNYDSLVIFQAADIWQINTTAQRMAQLPEVLKIVQEFYDTFGRNPTIQEMDMLSTKIIKIN
jgi:hypothetical protein